MRVSQKLITEQALRLQTTNYFPRDPDEASRYLTEISRALALAPDEIVVVAAMNDVLERCSSRPAPADVFDAIQRAKAPEEPSPYYETPESWKTGKYACRECQDTGWKIVERGGYSGAAPCACRAPVPQTASVRQRERRNAFRGGYRGRVLCAPKSTPKQRKSRRRRARQIAGQGSLFGE